MSINVTVELNSGISASASLSGTTVNAANVSIENSDDSYQETAAPGTTHELPDITHTDSDGSSVTQPAQTPFVATPATADMTANFSADATEVDEGDTVNFTDTTDQSPTHWSWRFGDGQVSIVQNPSITFPTAGTYDVTLEAANVGKQGDVEIKSNYITVNEAFAATNSFLTDGSDEVFEGGSGVVSQLNTGTGGWWIWCKFPTLGTTDIIWSVGDTSADNWIQVYKTSGDRLVGRCRIAGVDQWQLDTGVSTFSIDTWYLIGMTFDGSEAQLHLNNTAPSQNFTISLNKDKWIDDITGLDNFRIANRDTNGSGGLAFINMYFTEPALWNTDNSSERADIYNSGIPRKLSTLTTPPTLWWRPKNATFGTEWTMAEEQGTGESIVSVNMELGDRTSDVPS